MVILIVDDSKMVRDSIKSIIQAIPATIHECASGEEAVELSRQKRPEWILMDIEMGTMSGIEATRQIKNDLPKTNIAIVTMFDDAEYRREAREAGACSFIVKSKLLELETLLTKKKSN
ncbi:MAG: response regulator transcription factor [Ignavibacteriae bacterium]|nr:response regulator transcription factor [Ignavibacteriota bacterium]